MDRTITTQKVFGRRKGKPLSNRQKENIQRYLSKYSIFNLQTGGSFKLEKIDPTDLFNNLKDFELEIGFGMGHFLFQKALAQPNVGFLGCEVFENGVASLLTKVKEKNLKNILIHPGNCIDLLDNLGNAKLNAIHILFPDPWPKNKHHKRRFFTPENIDKMCFALKMGGSIFVATDIEEYASQMIRNMKYRRDFEEKKMLVREFKFPLGNQFQTKFERKAYALDRIPKYMVFRRVADG